MNKLEKLLYRFKFWRRFKAWLTRQENKPHDCEIESYEIDHDLIIEQKIKRLEKLKKQKMVSNDLINQRIEEIKNSRAI